MLLLIYANSQQDSFSCPARLREMTLLNFSFLFRRCEVKNTAIILSVRSKSTAYISLFANLFHFPKLSSVHNFHSLLRHLLTSEFAVLLFDCERYRLAAESIPQFCSYLRATKVFCSAFLQKSAYPVFFAAFFLKRKRVFLVPLVLLIFSEVRAFLQDR